MTQEQKDRPEKLTFEEMQRTMPRETLRKAAVLPPGSDDGIRRRGSVNGSGKIRIVFTEPVDLPRDDHSEDDNPQA